MNIAMLLDMAADGFGDRPAVSTPGDQTLTYTALRDAAAHAAERLTADRNSTAVACIGLSGAEIPIALFAAAYSGRTYAPLNHRLPLDALRPLVTQLHPATVIAAPPHRAAAPTSAPRWDSAALTATATPRSAPKAPEDPDTPAVLLFTSGTSAAPKPIRLQHDNLLAYVLGTVEYGCAAEDESLLLSVPPFHIAGVSAVLSSVYSGRRMVILPSFSAPAWLKAATDEHTTHAFVVPTMLARIVDELDAHPHRRPPALRHLAYGGARMPLPVLERALAHFPDTDFVNAYGLTETSSTIAVLGPEVHRAAAGGDAHARARLGSVGIPVPGIDIRIVHPDGTPVPVGAPGELLLRGPQVAGDTDIDGWFATGDQATLDDGGYLFVHGRHDDTIIRGGENISPGEVEDALMRHPDIETACVVGVPDLEWGERVEAAVVLRPGSELDVDKVLGWTRERVGTLKTPARIHVVEALPMTATGKVVRRHVRGELSGT
ncbi:class I adenylate-forming enzyme family protein [Yinghuangia sp. YIM S09857]|uniref:class I adenylate-forming enzyme family protein n=1 Tax=Yinghuangia sp. YIM S09857 TaxID=3436929 RepID=UPI003F52DBAB